MSFICLWPLCKDPGMLDDDGHVYCEDHRRKIGSEEASSALISQMDSYAPNPYEPISTSRPHKYYTQPSAFAPTQCQQGWPTNQAFDDQHGMGPDALMYYNEETHDQEYTQQIDFNTAPSVKDSLGGEMSEGYIDQVAQQGDYLQPQSYEPNMDPQQPQPAPKASASKETREGKPRKHRNTRKTRGTHGRTESEEDRDRQEKELRKLIRERNKTKTDGRRR